MRRTQLHGNDDQIANGAYSRPRVLFVDINAQFMNPTRNLLHATLIRSCRLECFGPGYVPEATLERGLRAFVDSTGPYDCIVTTSHFVFSDIYDEPIPARIFRKSYAFDFDDRLIRYIDRIGKSLILAGLPVVCMFLENDFYNWSDTSIERLRGRASAIVGFGRQFFSRRTELPNLKKEIFYNKTNDNWASYAAERPEKIANIFHYVGENEFEFKLLDERRYNWSILGIRYYARGIAKEKLRQGGVQAYGETPARRWLSWLSRLGLPTNANPLFMDLLNRDFRKRIANSKYSYTCGSGLDMPIRKFVEIPAAGAVLVCRPFNGFRETGFIDGVNCIVCEPEDVLDVHKTLEADVDHAQRIANAGQQLVAEQHSAGARSEQFRMVLAAVASGTFRGAHWRDGKFVLAGAPSQPHSDATAQ